MANTTQTDFKPINYSLWVATCWMEGEEKVFNCNRVIGFLRENEIDNNGEIHSYWFPAIIGDGCCAEKVNVRGDDWELLDKRPTPQDLEIIFSENEDNGFRNPEWYLHHTQKIEGEKQNAKR